MAAGSQNSIGPGPSAGVGNEGGRPPIRRPVGAANGPGLGLVRPEARPNRQAISRQIGPESTRYEAKEPNIAVGALFRADSASFVNKIGLSR